jgi:type IV pilus assembly protein PilM
MSKKLTTLCIEDNEIKLLVSAGTAVEKWATMDLDSGMVNEGIIMQEDAVAERLKSLAAENGVSGAKVIASISGQNSIFRLINIPDVPKNILDDAIMSEAARVIPVPLDQVYVARQQLNTGTPHEMRFFLAAYPKNAADTLMRTIQKAGLKTKVLDIGPLALARSTNVPRAILVNTWQSTIDIVIMVAGVPEVMRSFSLAAETSTDSERMLTIAEEVSRTVTFYNSSHTEAPIGADVHILVSGERAGSKDAFPVLGGAEGRPVELLTSAFTAPEGFAPSRFMVNLGLAQRDISAEFGSLINLNAIPAQYLPRGVNWFNILAPAVGVLLIGALAYAWMYVQDIKKATDEIQPQIEAIQLQITSAQARLTGLKADVTAANAAVAPVQSQGAAYVTQYNFLQAQRSYTSSCVRNASLKLPVSNVTLDTISWDGDILEVSGTAGISETNVFDYAANLRSTNLFENVVVTEIIKELTEDTKVYVYQFTLTLY